MLAFSAFLQVQSRRRMTQPILVLVLFLPLIAAIQWTTSAAVAGPSWIDDPSQNARSDTTQGADLAMDARFATEVSQSSATNLPIKYWGNSFSMKFHRPSCPFAKAMNPSHVVFFHLRKDAIAQGQQPCRYCLPPVVRQVRCVMLPKFSQVNQEQALGEEKRGVGEDRLSSKNSLLDFSPETANTSSANQTGDADRPDWKNKATNKSPDVSGNLSP